MACAHLQGVSCDVVPGVQGRPTSAEAAEPGEAAANQLAEAAEGSGRGPAAAVRSRVTLLTPVSLSDGELDWVKHGIPLDSNNFLRFTECFWCIGTCEILSCITGYPSMHCGCKNIGFR